MIWHRLNECYGSAEVVENALFKRIDDFPKISNKGYQKLRELSDLLMELQVAKAEGDLPGLAFLDTARGVNPIVQKLPYNLQERWMVHGSKFKQTYNVTFPPFTVFVDFVYQQAKMRNDPSFDLTLPHATPSVPNTRKAVTVHKTNVSSSGSFHRSADSSQEETNNKDPGKQCPLHQRPHPLLKCRAFRGKSIDDRKAFLKENHICYKCCSSTSHLAKDCKVSVKCTECDSTHHNTALHPGPAPWTLPHNKGTSEHGGEEGDTATTTPEVTSQCTEVCKGAIGGRSCSKICLVKVYPKGQRDKAIRLYAIMDDQSNGSLACPAFFDLFNIKGPSIPYSLKTCAGVIETAGRKASGYQVESIDGQICLPLPPITECSRIPDNRTEIPTPDAALHHAHLKCITHLIPELDPKAQIMLLLGRDILRVHKARDQINGPHNAPYAQKLDLGWVIIGDVCLGDVHRPTNINTLYTNTLENGRPSLFQPCPNHFLIKEIQNNAYLTNLLGESYPCAKDDDHLGCNVFQRSKNDNQLSLSIEDKIFLEIMDQGPDLNNKLLGVLIRFRKDPIAFIADIQQMFHSFLVREDHRNFLRFFWFRDNDPAKDVLEYRMKVHVFGNSPSPAVAIYGLRRSAQEGEVDYGRDVTQFVERDFYVDDGLKSSPSEETAISLLKRTQDMLACSNLRLHKIASNSIEVMKAFPSQDHANDLRDLDLGTDTLPVQRSLGLNWDLKSDTFTFQVNKDEKPFTRRGVLSTVNSLYDPLGFAAPVTVQGKALLRELTVESCDWDSPLPAAKEQVWIEWRDSLGALSSIQIPRQYTCTPAAGIKERKLCIFSDASTKAIAAVAYLKTVDCKGQCHIGFIMGKAKLTPQPEHTIPRLELCAAVLAVEMAELITSEIDLQLSEAEFYTDSKVVLGYICNETRRFYVYVSNRILRIRRSTHLKQWHYVPSEKNPADHATRAVPAACLKQTSWFTGPSFLYSSEQNDPADGYELIDTTSDPEIRPQVSTLCTDTSSMHLGSHRFKRFSTWKSLVRSITCLLHIVKFFKKGFPSTSNCKGWHYCQRAHTVDELEQARNISLLSVQQETYAKELECIKSKKAISKDSVLKKLDPFIDENGLLRVGGRIMKATLEQEEKNPLIIPSNHHIASLLVLHYHQQTRHQGRLFTEGALRAAGFWIVGAKKLVSSVIFKCVTCRKLRGMFQTQKMANLPADRLSTEPPFTNVGLDVFGPWSVTSRHTRGGHANSKRWAVMFTCLSIRAVHIEVIESMDTSSFVNALRRFISIRGPVKNIYSDRGTNFVGACKELNIPSNIDKNLVEKYLSDQGCAWTFNPPHSSHMGGAWERMIGIARRILDSMFLQEGSTRLTHETLTTFMAEVAAIMNARPLTSVSNDPEDPFILTPSTLLTQKVSTIKAPPGEFDTKDLYKRQWRQVQSLANTFWDKWKKQYIFTLQSRNKWQSDKQNIEPGNIVLMKDSQIKRNEWPLGLITRVFPSEDGKVRKVEVKVVRQNETKLFLRPISELILLLSSTELSNG
eukprot:XP_012820751.2 PREDICTED: uncharacterized protein LOC101731053 [Xenopus tropicalis]